MALAALVGQAAADPFYTGVWTAGDFSCDPVEGLWVIEITSSSLSGFQYHCDFTDVQPGEGSRVFVQAQCGDAAGDTPIVSQRLVFESRAGDTMDITYSEGPAEAITYRRCGATIPRVPGTP